MSEFPKFWETILQRLGLQSFDGIENIIKVVHFMGYTTSLSLENLRKPRELILFQIEAAKLNTNSQFCATYPELKNWQLGPGTIEILKKISNAAISSGNIVDLETVRQKVFQRCVKLAPNLLLSNVLIDLQMERLNAKLFARLICANPYRS